MTRNERKIMNGIPHLKKLIERNATLDEVAAYYQLKVADLRRVVSGLRSQGFTIPGLPSHHWGNGTKSRKENRLERLDKALSLRHNGKTFGEIGATLGVTRQRAYQLYNEAVASRE